MSNDYTYISYIEILEMDSTTVQFCRCCYVIQQMALLPSTAVLHFICSTRLLAETTPSVGFQNPIFVWREAQKTLVLWTLAPADTYSSLWHSKLPTKSLPKVIVPLGIPVSLQTPAICRPPCRSTLATPSPPWGPWPLRWKLLMSWRRLGGRPRRRLWHCCCLQTCSPTPEVQEWCREPDQLPVPLPRTRKAGAQIRSDHKRQVSVYC